jgi:acetyl-CoA carboxylase biotin carboxyl carrier protein
MDLRKLKTLIDLVSDSNVSELEITEAEGKVRIVKGPVGAPIMVAAPAPASMSAAPLAVQQAPSAPAAMSEAEQAAAAGHVVKSPMVGTFYASSSPEAKPFVQVGTVVKEGETICIIEAMKVMNEVKAEVSGVIAEICAENGKPVQFGQALFRLK